jgi:DNA-binding NtrC family response regulator
VGSSAKNGPAWLDEYGFSATPCFDSSEALRMLSEGHHQAILYDHAMPGMNGELLLKTVCADFPEVAALAVTQPGELRHGVLAMLAGASGYIQSPLRPEVMGASLRTALTKKWLDSAVRS